MKLSHQLILNIASVNIPKIKPETKVLIIKTLKSKSPAEVADIFSVSKPQVERIRKRQHETGDVHDRPRSGRPCKTTARDNSLLVRLSRARPMVNRLTAPGGVDASGACFVKNCMLDSCSQWSPRSYCCPETSAKQETAKGGSTKYYWNYLFGVPNTNDFTTEMLLIP